MKLKKTVGLLVVFSFIALAASLITCANPFAPKEEEQDTFIDGKGAFTINIGNNNTKTNNSREVYSTDHDIANLKFDVKFTPLAGGKEQTFSAAGNKEFKGYIDIGHYKVTMDVSTVSGNEIYARGVAEYNPVEIKAGYNFINVFAYDAANAYPPVVREQPQGAAYHVGAEAEAIKVDVDTPLDRGTITYQWYSNKDDINSGGTQILNATSATYTPPTENDGDTHYYVMITNEKDGSRSTSIPSRAVRIYVGNNAEPPEITSQSPKSQTVSYGNIATLSVTAHIEDEGTLSYQWYSNTTDSNSGGMPISGATRNTYNPPTTNVGTIYYYVVVTNTNNNAPGLKIATVTSNTASVTVSPGTGTEDDPFIVYNQTTWNNVKTAISIGGNGSADNYKNYTINIIGNFETASTTNNSFGSAQYINVTITGNHTITLTGNGNLLRLVAYQSVVIHDTDFVGHSGNNTSLIYVNGTNASLTMKGNSSVSNNNGGTGGGGGVNIGNGTFTMEGGTISGNTTASTSYGGGGVNLSSGTFTMSGGTISGNTAIYSGGGVDVFTSSGRFTKTGGTIYGYDSSAETQRVPVTRIR